MIWLLYIVIFQMGFLSGYFIRRSMEIEFHVECIDDEDTSWK